MKSDYTAVKCAQYVLANWSRDTSSIYELNRTGCGAGAVAVFEDMRSNMLLCYALLLVGIGRYQYQGSGYVQ